MSRLPIAGVLTLAVFMVPLRAQTPANPTYEVASVKPNKSGDMGIRIGIAPGGRFTVTNASLVDILRTAFGIQNFQVVGGPDWIDSDRFDIVAKASTDFPVGPPPLAGPQGNL
jgi:hypothetical protein